MKSNKIILLDFDRTLFDTDNFLLKLKNIFQEVGVDKNKFINSYKNVKPYNIKKHLAILNLESDKRNIILNNFSSLIKNINGYLFTDTINFLEFLNKYNIKSILVTYGDEQFQNEKIKNSNIENLIDEILITPNSQDKESVYKNIIAENENKKIIIVDDLEENTKSITNNISDIVAIKINRNNKNKEIHSSKNFYEVKDLDQAKKIISTL